MIVVFCILFALVPCHRCDDQERHVDDQAAKNEWEMVEKNRIRCQNLKSPGQKINKSACPAEFDLILCWPPQPAGTVSSQPCPAYVNAITNYKGVASRTCLADGTWLVDDRTNQSWTNYTMCMATIEPKPPSIEEDDAVLLELSKIFKEKERCKYNLNAERSKFKPNVSVCLPDWDGNLCWPSATPGEIVIQPCPGSIHLESTDAYVERKCLANGRWEMKNVTNDTKLDYSICKTWIRTPYELHIPTISVILRIGHIISVATLVLASIILAAMRRLRCPRNNLHLQLFASFIVRGALCIMKDYIYEKGTMALKWTAYKSRLGLGYETWDCKLFIAFWNYSLMANYSWILMEGLYLHNLIFHTMFTDRSNISRYIVFGWSLPIPFVTIWSILRINFDDLMCWTIYENYQAFKWILRGPTITFILINFAFFIRIIRVLFIKLRGGDLQKLDGESYRYSFRGRRYKKLIKSTLILVPLFGAYHIIFVIMSLASRLDTYFEITWLYSDAICTSLQGFVVAVLYCLMNPEVHTEIKRKWQTFKNRQTGGGMTSKKTAYSNSIQMTIKTARRSNEPVVPQNAAPVCQKEVTKETRSAQDGF